VTDPFGTEQGSGTESGELPAGRTLARLLAFARPHIALIVAVAFLTLLFAAGRFGRAYLMKPLLDGVLLPVAEAPASELTPAAEGDGWLDRAIAEVIPAPEAAASSSEVLAASPSRVRETFRQLLIAALVIVLVTPLALFGRSYLSEYVLGRIDIDIKQRMASKLLALPLGRHRNARSGDLLSRTLNDAAAAREALNLMVQELLVSVTMIGLGLATLLHISWPLTLVSLTLAPAIVVVLALFAKRIRRTARSRQEQLAEVTQRLVEILSGIKVIKAFGAESIEADAFARETRRLLRRNLRVVKNRIFSRAIVEALNSAAGIALLVIGAVLVLQGRWGLTTGDVAAFATVLATTYKPIKNLSKGHAKLMECLSSSERLFAVLDEPGEPIDPPEAVTIDGVRQGIRFEDVCVAHPDGAGGTREILRNIDLEIAAGEVVALVGRTGEGKTSLVDLLLRFDEPASGRILVDGKDVRGLSRRSLRRQIAVVTQEPFLFDTSIRDNIRYGRPDANDEEVYAAARAAHVDEFVAQLPRGWETEVGEFGVRLSGGQRQRVTIARALLARPAVLIFDEATSALDAKTERIVQETIDALRGDHTILLVSHRLSAVRRADRIAVLENGTIGQIGTDAELMAQDGLYRELALLQRQDPENDAPG
jgi:subfamily B ATP-binding cassette protein MsbA